MYSEIGIYSSKVKFYISSNTTFVVHVLFLSESVQEGLKIWDDLIWKS